MITLANLQPGETVLVDGGFDCMEEGSHEVHADEHGLYVYCRGHGGTQDASACRHYLDGQEDEGGNLIGLALPNTKENV